MIKDLEQRGPDELHVIVNWFEELKKSLVVAAKDAKRPHMLNLKSGA